MKNKVKNIMLIILGGIIFTSIGVIGSNVISANQVGINSSKTNKTNIQDAIDELYTKANKIAIDIKSKVPGATVVTSSLPTGVKAIVYMDPTNLSNSCNASNSVSTTGTKTGCMKWYVYADYNNVYSMIIDHNTTAGSYYNYENTNTSMGTRSASELTTEKGTTISINEIGYDLQQLTTTSGWKVTPRLITGQEIANITGNIEWTPSSSSYYFEPNCVQINPSGPALGKCSVGTNPYAWLFSYLGFGDVRLSYNHCTMFGCYETSDVSGYWTSTANTSGSSFVWSVGLQGNLATGPSASSTNCGLRPVITILK